MILPLYGTIQVSEKLYSRIFYAVKVILLRKSHYSVLNYFSIKLQKVF